MASKPAQQGIIVTIGLIQGDERYQVVFGLINQTGPISIEQDSIDALDWLETTFLPLLMDVLPTSTNAIGTQVEAMVAGTVIPRRKNYPLSSFVGSRAGDPAPLQTSLLSTFYSTDQIAAEPRTNTARKFWGAPSQTDINGGSLVDGAGFYAALDTLSQTLIDGFVATGGNQYLGALNIRRTAGNQVYAMNAFDARRTVFTQRRRTRPLI